MVFALARHPWDLQQVVATAPILSALEPAPVVGKILTVQLLFLHMIQTKRSWRVSVFTVETPRVSLKVLAHARLCLATKFHGAARIDSAYN